MLLIFIFSNSAGVVQVVVPLAFDQFFFADQVGSSVRQMSPCKIALAARRSQMYLHPSL